MIIRRKEERIFAKKHYEILVDGVDQADKFFKEDVRRARSQIAKDTWEARKKAVADAERRASEFTKANPKHPWANNLKEWETESARKKISENYRRGHYGSTHDARIDAMEKQGERIRKKRARKKNKDVGDILANKGTKNERIARLSEKNQIRYHNNNYYRGEEKIKLGESVSNPKPAPTSSPNPVKSTPITTSTSTTTSTRPSNTAPTSLKNGNSGVNSGNVKVSTRSNTKSIPLGFNKPKANSMKWSKAQIGGAAIGGAAVLGTGLYLANRKKKRDKQ
jgi:hypothetical protein